jgi:succinate-semialdehyde dehydrogenase/glutarate-semialdehyde dehydrogenase
VVAATVTGSELAGRAIAAQAGWLIKKTVLELGGSDPFIVMPSAEFDLAVAAAVRARCVNSGQSCIAAKRFLVAESIYDSFAAGFVAAMEAMKVGDPMREDTQIGPLATAAQVQDLDAQVQAAVRAGGRVLTGGERMLGKGQLLRAHRARGRPAHRRRLPRGTLRPGCAAVPRARYRRGNRGGQRHAVRPGRFGVDAQPGRAASLCRGAAAARSLSMRSSPAIRACPSAASSARATDANSRQPGMREFLNAKTVVIAEPAAEYG